MSAEDQLEAELQRQCWQRVRFNTRSIAVLRVARAQHRLHAALDLHAARYTSAGAPHDVIVQLIALLPLVLRAGQDQLVRGIGLQEMHPSIARPLGTTEETWMIAQGVHHLSAIKDARRLREGTEVVVHAFPDDTGRAALSLMTSKGGVYLNSAAPALDLLGLTGLLFGQVPLRTAP